MQENDSQKKPMNINESVNLKEQDIQNYFTFDNISDRNYLLASQYYSNKILGGIDILLNEGVIEIGRQHRRAEDLLDVKIDEEQLKLLQTKKKKQQIQKQLQYLNSQTYNKQQSNIDNPHFEKIMVYTKEQHKAYVSKIKKQRQERQQRHAQLLKKMQQKIQHQELSQIKQSEDQKKKQIQNRRDLIQKNLLKSRERYQQLKKRQRQSNDTIRDLKEHKNAFKKIQQKHQRQIILPFLQDKKQKLKQIRQFRSLSIQEINQHQKKYLLQRRYEQSKRHQLRVNWSYQPPPKPQRLSQILQFQMAEQNRKEEEKKSILENNLIKKENYIVQLRQNFERRIKIDPAKQEEILERLQKKNKEKINSDVDIRKIGLSYLQQAGKKKRKQIKLQDIFQEKDLQKGQQLQQRAQTQKQMTRNTIKSGNQTKSKALSNYQTTHHDSTFYQKNRRKKIQKIINKSQLSQAQKIKMLTLQANKIQQNFKMKELQLKYKKDQKMKNDNVQLLLSSIQAKIGIMQIYQ